MEEKYYKQYEPFFGTWNIVRQIGEGSFGKVFEIERHDIGGTYKAALKAITIPSSNAEVEDMLADGMNEQSIAEYFHGVVEEIVGEFVLMSKLKGNSNIVSYEDHTVIRHNDGIGWDILIRMELLTPLKQYAKSVQLQRKDIIQLGIDMCKALELCQKHNIIHRDIKPENIFISDSGDYKLGDFGIARTVDKTVSSMSKKGTYSYMAPEVFKGEAYGTSVDIYSLGIVMYRMLNDNRTPFLPPAPNPITHNDSEAALTKRIQGAPIPKPAHADGRLAEIVLRACAYHMKDRYQAPLQMRMELEAILYERSESALIYPTGDALEIRSNQYVSTGDVANTGKTDALLSDTSYQDHTEILYNADAKEMISASAGNAYVAPQKKTGNKIIPIVIAAVLVLVVGLGGFAAYVTSQNHVKQMALESDQEYSQSLKDASSMYKSDEDSALDKLSSAIELDDTKPEAYAQYLYCLYQNGRYDKAIEAAESGQIVEHKIIESDEYKLVLASCYFETGDYEHAGELYYDVSQTDQESFSIENLRDYAVCLGRLGRLDEAATVFVMLTDKGASADVTSYVLGETYYAKQDYANAENAFLDALGKTQDDNLIRRIYISLAETYRDSQDADKSISTIEEALAKPQLASNTVLNEMLGAAYYQRAQAVESGEDYIKAGECFKKVIDFGVQKQYLYTNAYAAYMSAGQMDAAKQILNDEMTVYPDSYLPHAQLAMILIQEENQKPQESRDYAQVIDEYNTASGLATSQDNQTELMQLEGYIEQLKNGGWITGNTN